MASRNIFSVSIITPPPNSLLGIMLIKIENLSSQWRWLNLIYYSYYVIMIVTERGRPGGKHCSEKKNIKEVWLQIHDIWCTVGPSYWFQRGVQFFSIFYYKEVCSIFPAEVQCQWEVKLGCSSVDSQHHALEHNCQPCPLKSEWPFLKSQNNEPNVLWHLEMKYLLGFGKFINPGWFFSLWAMHWQVWPFTFFMKIKYQTLPINPNKPTMDWATPSMANW